MPRRASNLQKRGNIWWLRVCVPDELRDAIIKTEPLKSLRTADLKAAERLACIARVNLDTQVGGHPQRRHKPKRELSQSEL